MPLEEARAICTHRAVLACRGEALLPVGDRSDSKVAERRRDMAERDIEQPDGHAMQAGTIDRVADRREARAQVNMEPIPAPPREADILQSHQRPLLDMGKIVRNEPRKARKRIEVVFQHDGAQFDPRASEEQMRKALDQPLERAGLADNMVVERRIGSIERDTPDDVRAKPSGEALRICRVEMLSVAQNMKAEVGPVGEQPLDHREQRVDVQRGLAAGDAYDAALLGKSARRLEMFEAVAMRLLRRLRTHDTELIALFGDEEAVVRRTGPQKPFGAPSGRIHKDDVAGEAVLWLSECEQAFHPAPKALRWRGGQAKALAGIGRPARSEPCHERCFGIASGLKEKRYHGAASAPVSPASPSQRRSEYCTAASPE